MYQKTPDIIMSQLYTEEKIYIIMPINAMVAINVSV